VYNNPKPNASNPSSDAPIVNADGTYSFASNTPGEYIFMIPIVTPSGDTIYSALKITVLPDALVPQPAPIANPDIAGTAYETNVTINTLANDSPAPNGAPINIAGTTIVTQPINGTATINTTTGAIIYTPANGFSGTDVLTYQIIDANGKTATATQTIIVQAPNATNITLASDDYNSTPHNTKVFGNVLPNDSDPEGDNQFVVAQSFTFIVGSFAIDASGNYTVTPPTGFTGTLKFPYTIYDNNANVDTAKATLYIYVGEPVYGTPDINVTYVNVSVNGNVSSNDANLISASYGAPIPSLSNPSADEPIVNADGTYSFVSITPGIYYFDIAPCVDCLPIPLKITVLDTTSDVNPPIVTIDIRTMLQGGNVIINSLSNDATTNSGDSLNASSASIIRNPKHGTVSIDPLTGNTIYTPNPAYVGTDTLVYLVCNSNSPAQCDSAMQIITVLPVTAPNNTDANDDIFVETQNTIVTGNVIVNDGDAQGDKQSVIPFNITVAGEGTIVMDANGNFTFTPDPSFVGTFSIPYTVFDSNKEQASKTATLYIVIKGKIFTVLQIDNIVLSGQVLPTSNELVWRTTNEKDIAKFVLFRSADGINFTPIAEQASGNTSNTSASLTYQYNDETISQSYYKVQAKSINGVTKESNTIVLERAVVSNISLYPNPANDYVQVEFVNKKDKSITIKILDALGKVVKIIETNVGSGVQTIRVDIGELANANYTLQLIQNKNIIWNSKFSKQ
jgi:membrane-bound inhibitor of C-type lysozyme